jgi:hypothetical protein
MFVEKKSLSRRTFLRGAGTVVALPFLDAMVPAFAAAGNNEAPRRLAAIYIPQGVNYHAWGPVDEGTEFAFSQILSPLEPFRKWTFVPTNLDHKQAESWGDGDGDHARGASTWLSGVHPKKSLSEPTAGVSIDQMIAQEAGKHTRLSSMELSLEPVATGGACNPGYSCAYERTVSWRTPNTPLPTESNPRAVFDRLFGDGGTAEQRSARLKEERSILDSIVGEMARLQSRLGTRDRSSVSDYLDAIRDSERRIAVTEENSAQRALALPDAPVDLPEDFEERTKMMFDLQALAFQGDVTRVFTTLVAREESQRTYTQIGISEGHHPLSHHQEDPEKLAKLAKIDMYHVQLLAYFLERLRTTADGDGSLLDHSLVLYGSGLGNGSVHNHINLPTILVGGAGGFKGGRHIRYPEHTPMSNLLVGVMNRMGMPIEKIGDSTGPLAGM